MERHELSIRTGTRLVTDVTDAVAGFCTHQGGDGLVHVFAPHATAGLALLELGSGSESDLAELVERLLPRERAYLHRHGSRGHGGDHVLPVMVSPSLVLAVVGGQVRLGTWQRIALVDPNRDNPMRRIELSFLPG